MSQSAPSTQSQANYQIPPGRLGNLSPQQQQILDQFRTELQAGTVTTTTVGLAPGEQPFKVVFVPERHDDPTLLRFLRARKFDLQKSKDMIAAAEKWRIDFGVEQIMKDFEFAEKAEVNKYYPQFYHKTDKEGRPIYIEILGRLDVNKLYQITSEDRLLKRLVYEYERCLNTRMPASSRAAGHPVETFCTILDLNNVGLKAFYQVREYVSQASKIGQDYYPECMGKFYIINAPYLFSAVWAVVKNWLDEVTVKKIQIMSSGHREVLLKQIPPHHLPKMFGGVCDCAGGCEMSDDGPWKEEEEAQKTAAVAATAAANATTAEAAPAAT